MLNPNSLLFRTYILLLSLLCLTFPVYAEKTKIGFLLPLSGPFAEGGLECQEGINVTKTLYPDREIFNHLDFIFSDSLADTKTAIVEYRKLVEYDKVATMLSSRSNVCLAIAELSNSSGFPFSCLIGHKDFINKSKFGIRSWPLVDLEANAIARAVKQKITDQQLKIDLITLEDEWMLSFEKAFIQAAERNNLLIGKMEKVSADFSDFKNLIARLKNSTAIFANLGPSQLATFLKQLRQSGYNGLIISSVFVAQNEVQEVAGEQALEGVIFAETSLRRPKFKAAFIKENNDSNLTAFNYICYAGLWMLLDTINDLRMSGSSINPASIWNRLSKTSKINLADETLPVENREIIFDVRAKFFNHGTINEIEQ